MKPTRGPRARREGFATIPRARKRGCGNPRSPSSSESGFGGRYGRYGRPYWGHYWGPYGGGGWYRGYGGYYSPYYDREAAVLIRDKRSGEPLYEARAQSQGPTTGLTTVLPALFVAAMKDFPTGSTTNPRRITVEMAR